MTLKIWQLLSRPNPMPKLNFTRVQSKENLTMTRTRLPSKNESNTSYNASYGQFGDRSTFAAAQNWCFQTEAAGFATTVVHRAG